MPRLEGDLELGLGWLLAAALRPGGLQPALRAAWAAVSCPSAPWLALEARGISGGLSGPEESHKGGGGVTEAGCGSGGWFWGFGVGW